VESKVLLKVMYIRLGIIVHLDGRSPIFILFCKTIKVCILSFMRISVQPGGVLDATMLFYPGDQSSNPSDSSSVCSSSSTFSILNFLPKHSSADSRIANQRHDKAIKNVYTHIDVTMSNQLCI